MVVNTRLRLFWDSSTISHVDHIEFARMGAKARNKSLTKAERAAAARHAVNTRWDRVRKEQAAAAKLAKRKNGTGK